MKVSCDRKKLKRIKPVLRAKGSSLLPLALRPGLLKAKKNSSLASENAVIPFIHQLLKFSKKSALFGLLTISLIGGSVGILEIPEVHASQISLSLPSKIELNLNPAVEGSFSESDSANFSVDTDYTGGYNLSVRAKTSNDLVNDSNPESKLTTISDNLSKDQYQNGDYNNTWAFRPDHYNSELNTFYRPGPDTDGVILSKTTSQTTEKDQYKLTIAAKVDETMPPGQYSNTFVMTATVNDERRYIINYDAESLSGATNADVFTTQTGVIVGDSQTIYSVTPTKEGATFTGWCDQALTEDGACEGSIIQPGGELRMCDCDTEVTLYAMWKNSNANYVGNLGSMQAFHCSMLAEVGDYGKVTDDRDKNSYKVAMLKDGRCWMVQNLRLGGIDLRNRTLTPEDSDVIKNFTLPESSTSGFTQTTAINLYVDVNYGGYYTWNAATAGTGATTKSGNAISSICPKGWRLPTGKQGGEFDKMVNYYGTKNDYTAWVNSLQSQPAPNLTLSGGYYGDNYPAGQGTVGNFWSSTILTTGDGDESSNLYMTPTYINTLGGNAERYHGYSVRCIARDGIDT